MTVKTRNDELRFIRKVLAVAETFHELSPDKQQQRLADLAQECSNPYDPSVLKGLRNYQAMGQLENFRACLRTLVQQKEKKMTNDTETPMPPVDRETASRINPLIDSHAAGETLLNVSGTLALLGQMFVCSDHSKVPVEFGKLHYLLTALRGAREYEAHQDKPKPEEKEAPVKRVK